jgi:HEPN domain-containing protein
MEQNETIARKWIKRAESSLAKSKIGVNVENILLEDLCFDAQQATEKALKGLLAFTNISIPKTHSISFLIKTLEDGGIPIPTSIIDSVTLTSYAVETRYPGDYEKVELEEYEQAVILSESVVDFVKKYLLIYANPEEIHNDKLLL